MGKVLWLDKAIASFKIELGQCSVGRPDRKSDLKNLISIAEAVKEFVTKGTNKKFLGRRGKGFTYAHGKREAFLVEDSGSHVVIGFINTLKEKHFNESTWGKFTNAENRRYA